MFRYWKNKETKENHCEFKDSTDVTDHVQEVVYFSLMLQASLIQIERILVYQVRLIVDSHVLQVMLAKTIKISFKCILTDAEPCIFSREIIQLEISHGWMCYFCRCILLRVSRQKHLVDNLHSFSRWPHALFLEVNLLMYNPRLNTYFGY